MSVYAGLDGGSTYLKAAMIGNGRVIDPWTLRCCRRRPSSYGGACAA